MAGPPFESVDLLLGACAVHDAAVTKTIQTPHRHDLGL
jgi:hypothetical protein